MPDDTFQEMFSSYMSPWLRMDDKAWNTLVHDVPIEFYEKETVIYHQGDLPSRLYLVKEGRVCLDLYSKNGKKRSIYIADKGTCFGELSCLDGLPNYCTATTRTATALYLIPRKKFIEEVRKNPQFTLSLLKALSLKTRLITELLEQLNFNDSHQRLYYSLIGLIERYSIQTKEGYYRLNIKFTHQEMAHQTGLSRVCISNIFLSLTNKGYIEKKDGYLMIKDMNALRDYLMYEELKE